MSSTIRRAAAGGAPRQMRCASWNRPPLPLGLPDWPGWKGRSTPLPWEGTWTGGVSAGGSLCSGADPWRLFVDRPVTELSSGMMIKYSAIHATR